MTCDQGIRRPSILVVDDDSGIREMMASFLEAYGFDVTTAVDGQAALDVIERNADRFSTVLTDFQMPYLDGATLIREIRRKNFGIDRLILMSANMDAPSLCDSDTSFLPKPFQTEQLLAALEFTGHNGPTA